MIKLRVKHKKSGNVGYVEGGANSKDALGTGCKDCFFNRFKYDDDVFIRKNIIGACSERKDKNDVIFVKVKE